MIRLIMMLMLMMMMMMMRRMMTMTVRRMIKINNNKSRILKTSLSLYRYVSPESLPPSE